jgi:hypothetical protein
MNVGIRIYHFAKTLDGHHCAGNEGLVLEGDREECPDGQPGCLGQQSKQAGLTAEQSTQHLRQRQSVLAMNHRGKHFGVQKLAKQQRALLVAAGAEAVCLAGEGQ